jgi:hypothetical protein
MVQNNQLLIHIGYHKAGSTCLQQVLFKDEKAGFFTPWGAQSGQAIVQFVVPNAYSFSPESARKALAPGLQEARKRGLIPVLSHEALSDNPIKGNYCGKMVADRIYATFPEARIFIIIREQKSMIMSSYRQHIKIGGTETIQEFIGADINKPAFKPTCRLDYLEWDLPIAYYQKHFGTANVLVLPLELLSKNQKLFVQKILGFAGVDLGAVDIENFLSSPKNVGFKGATLAVRRRLNYFIENPIYARSKGQSPLDHRLASYLSVAVDRLLPLNIHQQIGRAHV